MSYKKSYEKNIRADKKKSGSFFVFALVLTALPFLACLVRLLATGNVFNDIWPIASTWNDEPMYYKQIEGMVKFGIPQGYFGYNESTAPSLTFGAWVPSILFPFSLWGKVFGWSFLSPYFFNMVFFAISLFIFALLVKPDLRETCLVFLALFAFTPLSRLTFSYMPEILIAGLVVILLGLYISADKTPRYISFLLMCLILVYLTTIRPYFAVLFVLPFLLTFKYDKKQCVFLIIFTIVLALLSVYLYSYLTGKYTAAYIGDVYTDYFGKIFTHGPRLVFNEATESLKYNFALLCFYIKKAVTSLNYVGAYYLAFLITTVLLFLCALIKFFENKAKFNTSVLFYLFLFFGQALVLLAILVLYVFADGFRHLIAFIIADTVVILCDKKLHKTLKLIFGGLIIATFVFLFVAKIKIPEAYYVPYLESESVERTEFTESKKALEEKMPLTSEVSRDNTVDIVLDSASSLEAYYLVPAGFGISMCEESYIEENISSLKNKYLLVPAGSGLNNIAGSNGYTLIFKNERLSLYSR